MADTLSPTMTLRDFENGYWYLDQLKNFAQRIGVPAAKRLRKDELERAIVAFLRTGEALLPTERSLRKTGAKDVERGLSLKLSSAVKEWQIASRLCRPFPMQSSWIGQPRRILA